MSLDRAEESLNAGSLLLREAKDVQGAAALFRAAILLACSDDASSTSTSSTHDDAELFRLAAEKARLPGGDAELRLHGVFVVGTAAGQLAESYMILSSYQGAIGAFAFATSHLLSAACDEATTIPTFLASAVKLKLRQAEAHRHVSELDAATTSLLKAQEVLTLAVAAGTLPENEASELQVAVLSGRAAAAIDLVDYMQAVVLYQEALDVRRKVYSDAAHPKVSSALVNLASAELRAGLLDSALQHAEQGLAIRLGSNPPSHPLVAAAQYLKARVLQERGTHDEALPLFEQAVQSRKAFFGPTHASVSQALSAQADVLVAVGRHDEAKAVRLEAEAASKKTGVPRAARPISAATGSIAAVPTNAAPLLEEGEDAREERERAERLAALAAAKAQKEKDRLEAEAAARSKRDAAEAARLDKMQREQKERELAREVADQTRMEAEDARSLRVELSLRAREEKLRAARQRKAAEEAERQARKDRELEARRLEEERIQRERAQREKAAREEARKQQDRELREYRDRLENAMEDCVRERERQDAARAAATPSPFFSFRAIWQGLHLKDVQAASPSSATSSTLILPRIPSSPNRPGSLRSDGSGQSPSGYTQQQRLGLQSNERQSSPARKLRIMVPGESRSQSPGGRASPKIGLANLDMDDSASVEGGSSIVSAAPLALVVLSPGKFHLVHKSKVDDSMALSLQRAVSPQAALPRLFDEPGPLEDDDNVSLGNSSMTLSLMTLSVDGGRRRRRQPLLLQVQTLAAASPSSV